jgi:hypothetical protein
MRMRQSLRQAYLLPGVGITGHRHLKNPDNSRPSLAASAFFARFQVSFQAVRTP